MRASSKLGSTKMGFKIQLFSQYSILVTLINDLIVMINCYSLFIPRRRRKQSDVNQPEKLNPPCTKGRRFIALNFDSSQFEKRLRFRRLRNCTPNLKYFDSITKSLEVLSIQLKEHNINCRETKRYQGEFYSLIF